MHVQRILATIASLRRQPALVLGLIAAVHLIVTMLWLGVHAPVEFVIPDSFVYNANLHHLRTVLETGGIQAALAYLRELNSHYSFLSLYPPALLSLPFEDVDRAARGANVLYFLVLIGSTFGIGRRCHSTSAGLLAAALVSLTPAVYGGWRTIGVDFPAMCVTSLAVWMLIRSERFSNLRASLGFGAAAGVAILCKAQSIFFLLPPAAYVLFTALTGARSKGTADMRRVLLTGVATVATVLLVTALWWGGRLSETVEKLTIHSSGEGMLFFEGDISLWGGVTYYLGALPLLLTGAVTVTLALVAYPFWRSSRHRVVILLWLVVPLVLHMVLKVRHFRYLFPLVPAAAVMVGVGLSALRPKLRRWAVPAVVLAAVALWILCPLVGSRCPGLARPSLERPRDLMGAPSSPASFLVSCGDYDYVAPRCPTETGERVLALAHRAGRWMQGARRSGRPAVLYHSLPMTTHAAAIRRHYPALWLSLSGFAQLRAYAPGAGWDRFVFLSPDVPVRTIEGLQRTHQVFVHEVQTTVERKDGGGEEVSARRFAVLRLAPKDPWPVDNVDLLWRR